MNDQARRGYRRLANLFLIVGGVFTVLALLQLAGAIRFFQGNPLGVAVLVLVIGVLLAWTVRTAPPAPPEEGEDGPVDPGPGDEPGPEPEAPNDGGA